MAFLRTSLLAVVTCALAGGVAHAGPGLRVGVTSEPDSLFAGLQWRAPLSQVGPGRFILQPGGDIGIVDGPIDLFLRGTLHLGYMIPISNEFGIYPLAGPSLIWVKVDDASDTDIGLDVGVGAQFQNFALEVWFGAIDSFDVTAGLSFNL